MNIKDFFTKKNKVIETHVEPGGQLFHVISTNRPYSGVLFSQNNAQQIARSLPETNFAIDLIADSVASLPFRLVKKDSGIDVPLTPNLKKITSRPNIVMNWTDFIYNSVFNELSDGNCYYLINNSLKTIKTDNISAIWSVDPVQINIKYKNRIPSIYTCTSIKDLVDYYEIDGINYNVDLVHHYSFLPTNDLIGKSPLFSVEKNINILMNVYQARLNIFEKNGCALIISAQQNDANSLSSKSRNEIVKDLFDRNGLVGDKQLIGISSVPLQAINTLASIKDLQPFEETKFDALAIASNYKIDKDLVPSLTGTTFDNKYNALKQLWADVVVPKAFDTYENISTALKLDVDNLLLVPNLDGVEILNSKKKQLEVDVLLLQNLKNLELDVKEVNDIKLKILKGYAEF